MSCTQILAQHIRAPYSLAQMGVHYDGHTFFVINSKQATPILAMNLSQELRSISSEKLEKVLKVGYLTLSQIGEHYALRFHGRVLGGGLFGAGLTYVGAMTTGGVLIAVGTITAPMGGAVLIAAGAATITAAPFVAAVMIGTPTP